MQLIQSLQRQFLILAVFLCSIHFIEGGSNENEDHGSAHDLTVHVYYEDIYNVLVFLIATYAAGKVTETLGTPALVGEIIAGFLLGPPLADFAPYPEALVLIGEIGLIFLILDAGIHTDVAQLRQTGTVAASIALTGSLLALGTGVGIFMLMASDANRSIKGALAIGASFAPTSLGVAASALNSGGMGHTPIGQLITASCVVDDVIGLILLSMFQVLVKEDPKIIEYFIPLISSVGFLFLLGLPAVTVLPRFIQNKYLPMFSKKNRQMAMFGLMFAMGMAYLPIMNYTKSSYLTGAFLAGLAFSQVDGAYKEFMECTHSIVGWLLRVFFSASIGFQVPVVLFKEVPVLTKGLAFWASCVLVKSFVAALVPHFESKAADDAIYNPYKRDLVVTGLSMTCRGEFSFIIAAFALSEGVIDPETYAAVVLAVLLSAITSPFMLMKSISYFKVLQDDYLKNTKSSMTPDGKMALFYHIHLEMKGAWSILQRLRDDIESLGLHIEDFRTQHVRGYDPIIYYDIYVRDLNQKITNETIDVENKIQKLSSNRGLMKEISRKGSLVDIQAATDDDQEGLALMTKKLDEEEMVENRLAEIQRTLQKKVNDLTLEFEMRVTQWKPWDWTVALDTMVLKRSNGQPIDKEFLMHLFRMVDADGNGNVDSDELYEGLTDAGFTVTKEGIDAMIASIDEDQDGTISLDEWEKAITLYLDKIKEGNISMKYKLFGSDPEAADTSSHSASD